MTNIPTIKIKTGYGRGWAIINEADFDPAIHQPFDAAAKAPEPTKPEEGPTEDEMRAAIKEATGKAPHHKLGREKLVEQFLALNSEA